MQLSDYQRDILIRTILGEARGEGDIGMAAVAHNIRNRALSGQFPDDPAKVALQPKQYSVWNEGAGGGKTEFSKSSDLYKRAERLVDGVFNGQIPDMTGGALYYHTPSVSPSWSSAVNKHGTSQIGNHIFYHGRPTPPGEIPNMVASALDVAPPQPATPVTASPNLNALRNAPSQQPDMRAALDALRTAQMGTPDMGSINALYATPPQPRAPITQNDLLFQSGIADTISGTQALQAGQGDLASALERMLRPTLPTRSAQELAGIYADGGPTRPPVATPRLASPAQVAAAGAGSPWGAADGPTVRPKLAPTKSAPAMPLNVAQSYAGQERASTPAPKAAPRAILGQSGFAAQQGAPGPNRQALEQEVMQALGETVAVIPTTRPTPGQSGFAGQDTARTASLPKIGPTGGPALNSAPKPANQSIDIAMRREPGQTIATIPTTGSGVGKPPATKVVPSVPVNTAPKTAQTVPKGMPTSSRSRDAVAQQTAGTRTAAMWGSGAAKEVVASPAKPNPTGYGSGTVKADNTRLAAGVYPKAPSGLDAIGVMPQFADLGTPPSTRVAVVAPSKAAPIPRARPTAVGTQLAVTPPVMRQVARPRPRPQVQRAPQLRIVVNGGNVMRQAPVPMMRPMGLQQQAAQMMSAGLLNQASYQALSNGQSSYVGSDGGVQPTVAMNGKVRNTYGD